MRTDRAKLRKTNSSVYHYPQKATRDHLARAGGGCNLGSCQFDYSLPRLSGTIDSKRGIDDGRLLPHAWKKKAITKRDLVDLLIARENHENARARLNNRIQTVIDCHSIASIRDFCHLSFDFRCHFCSDNRFRELRLDFLVLLSYNIFLLALGITLNSLDPTILLIRRLDLMYFPWSIVLKSRAMSQFAERITALDHFIRQYAMCKTHCVARNSNASLMEKTSVIRLKGH